MDKGRKYLSNTECFFLLNNERSLNSDGSKRGSLGMSTPMVANYAACDIQFPAGESFRTGGHYAALTNEAYSWTYNSNGIHFIQRLNGDGSCQIVYHGCLRLSAKPAAAIEQWRAYLKVEKVCHNRHGKYLVWCDGENEEIGYLDVEASIATNYFTTPFFYLCPDPCAYIQLCVPQPCGCLHAEYVPLPNNEISLTNHLIDNGFKFIFRFWYYDGRKSEWSDVSSLYYQDIKGCFDSSIGASRCLKLRVPIGNPLVEKIEIGFNKGDKNTETNTDIWLSSEVIEKYKKYNSSQQYWYQRELSEQVSSTYSGEDCSFDYYFCNDKQCSTIDIKTITRVYDPIPRKPQGFLILKDEALGVYNYEQGNCPIDITEIQKLDITLNCDGDDCTEEFANVTVRAVIHDPINQVNQFIYRLGGDNDDTPDDVTDTAYFGGLNPALSGGFETGYSQQFKDKTRNFIAYIEGTDQWGEMKQWHADRFFQNLESPNPPPSGVQANMNDVNTRNRWRRDRRHGNFFYQEYIFRVRKGTKGFIRLASHEVINGSGSNQNTSTFVMGVMNNITQYKGNAPDIFDITNINTHEIYFDTCNGDVDNLHAFVIRDNAVDTGIATKATAYNGYIKDKNNQPIEGARVYIDTSSNVSNPIITDHNGFYHFYLEGGDKSQNENVNAEIKVEQDCNSDFQTIQTMSIVGETGTNTKFSTIIDNTNYVAKFFAKVQLQVKDCDGNGVGGLRVALSGTKYKVTDGGGISHFKIRNYELRNRTIRAIVLNNNGCFTVDCNGNCNPCMPDETALTPTCYASVPVVFLPTVIVNRESISVNANGLKAGGRYGLAAVVKWPCGRISAPYEVKYFNIPKTQEKNKQSFCSFDYTVTSNMNLPIGASCLEIVRTQNLNPFELQWVIDQIDRTTDGKIKLTIQSLNDYNAQYFFQTNTVYQWAKNDRVEFIKNGDGKIFSIVQYGLLNYQTLSPFNDEDISGIKSIDDASFFNQLLIEDDGKLDGLTVGAIIEIQRSKECTTEPVYFGICATIPIVNGQLLYPTGTFHTFDTYIVNRTITYKNKDTTGTFPRQSFEHHSPSDFWGNHLTDQGKPYFVNQYENQRRFGRNISINSPSQYNYFGDLVKTFDAPGQGDITAMDIKDGQIILGICEHDNFLAQTADDLVRVGSDNTIRALSADAVISDAQPKISGEYGCQYDSIGSIFFGDGFANWTDVNNGGYIKHDYNIAKDVSEGKTHTFFKRRCQEIEAWNRIHSNHLDQFRFATGQNKTTNAIQLTLKALRHSGINNEIEPFLKPNETILFDPKSEDFLTFASYTAEGYSQINLFDGKGCSFISYLNGVPFIHPIVPDTFNQFFEIPCDWIIGISINKFTEKIKVPLAAEIESELMWYVKKITTDKASFISEVPPIKVKKTERKWNFAFLNDKNSRGGLYSGQPARGFFVSIILVRDNSLNLAYNSIDNTKRVQYSELDQIVSKFFLSEQSGVTENV